MIKYYHTPTSYRQSTTMLIALLTIFFITCCSTHDINTHSQTTKLSTTLLIKNSPIPHTHNILQFNQASSHYYKLLVLIYLLKIGCIHTK